MSYHVYRLNTCPHGPALKRLIDEALHANFQQRREPPRPKPETASTKAPRKPTLSEVPHRRAGAASTSTRRPVPQYGRD